MSENTKPDPNKPIVVSKAKPVGSAVDIPLLLNIAARKKDKAMRMLM